MICLGKKVTLSKNKIFYNKILYSHFQHTGVTMQANKRLQINVAIEPSDLFV